MHRLEVIVTSAAEAAMAAEGGADRLELVRALDTGGLTPHFATVKEVSKAVSIPVRVMLRGNSTMSISCIEELRDLTSAAAEFRRLPLDGLVMGWISPAGGVDLPALEAVLAAAPECNVTFHRAFEQLADPLAALPILKRFPQVDRILTCGGAGPWPERKRRLLAWINAAAPEIGIIVGGGLSTAEVAELMADARFPEVHVGRAARTPEENGGQVDPGKIAFLKSLQAQ
jgi:copper homeostasis protein